MINTFARGFYFRFGRHNMLIRNRSCRSQKRMGSGSLRRRAKSRSGKGGGGRRPLDHDRGAIVALVADVARRCQLRVGRSELLAVLCLNCPVEGHQRIFDRRRDQIGDRQIPIFRQDLDNVREGFVSLIELIGGIGPVPLVPGESPISKSFDIDNH